MNTSNDQLKLLVLTKKHTSKENMQIAAAGEATKPNERTVFLRKCTSFKITKFSLKKQTMRVNDTSGS